MKFQSISKIIKKLLTFFSKNKQQSYTDYQSAWYICLLAFLSFPFPLRAQDTTATTTQTLEKVNVTVKKNRATETATLAEQKQSTQIVEIMGSQEMSRKGASDAQAAVIKMAGISKEEGSSQIFVRGLGDRYNSTMLNGLFLPSDNPEFKNISLEYFPADIIQSVNVSKTYNNTLLGDFGGATINISTKDHFGKPFVSASVKTGFNTNAIQNKNLGSGVNFWGIAENENIPTTINGQFIDRNWTAEERTMPKLNTELSVNAGWSKQFTDQVKLSLFGTVALSNKFQYNEGMTKIVDAQANIKDSAYKKSSSYSVNQIVMLNSTLQTSEKFKIKFNVLRFNTVLNQWNDYTGYDGGSGFETIRRRSIKDINTLHIAQVINEYTPTKKTFLALNIAYNDIQNNQPDRLTQSYNYFNQQWLINTNQAGNMGSYYQLLHERDLSVNATSKFDFSKDSNGIKPILSIGFTHRYKYRDFTQYEYVFRSNVPNPSGETLPETIDSYFSLHNLQQGKYSITAERFANGKVLPSTYIGDLQIESPSLNFEINPTKKFILALGARADIIAQSVVWNVVSNYPNKGSVDFSVFKLLPYLNLKYTLTELQNLKFSFSKTYTLPQFKELAPFLYNDISTFNTRGNPFLYTSDNYNFDLKWELFPIKSELISVAGFSKFISNPINKIFEAATGQSQMTYANSGNLAMVMGIEIEVKKALVNKMNTNDASHQYQLLGGFNISALYSYQDLSTSKVVAETKDKTGAAYTSPVFSFTHSPLQGASPVVFNVDITYRAKIKNYEPQATITLNYFHDRLYAIGAQTAGNAYEKGVLSLDLITKHTFSNKLIATLNIKNLLNPNIIRYQEFKNSDLILSQFKRGIDVSVGFNYIF